MARGPEATGARGSLLTKTKTVCPYLLGQCPTLQTLQKSYENLGFYQHKIPIKY